MRVREDNKPTHIHNLKPCTPHPPAALRGVLKRCCALPHLERLSLLNMLVEDDDFSAPFSAPNLRHICLRNCGEGSLEAASNFITNPDQLLDVASGERTAVACICECRPSDYPKVCGKCRHKRFEGEPLWLAYDVWGHHDESGM